MSGNSNGLPSLDINSIWEKLTSDIQMSDSIREIMKEQFTKEFAEWLTTENVSESNAIRVSAEAAFRLISDFASIASGLSKQLQKPIIQGMSDNSQTPNLASVPGNPNQLSGNTTMVFPPTSGPSSQIGDAHMSPTRGSSIERGIAQVSINDPELAKVDRMMLTKTEPFKGQMHLAEEFMRNFVNKSSNLSWPEKLKWFSLLMGAEARRWFD